MENTILYISLVSSVVAAIGLFFTARAFYQERETREIQTIDGIIEKIFSLEKSFKDKKLKPEEIKGDSSIRLLLNTIDWYAFLVNEKKIKDEKIVAYFNQNVTFWYEEIFRRWTEPKIFEDPTKYKEFRKLHQNVLNQASS